MVSGDRECGIDLTGQWAVTVTVTVTETLRVRVIGRVNLCRRRRDVMKMNSKLPKYLR